MKKKGEETIPDEREERGKKKEEKTELKIKIKEEIG